MGAPGGPCHKVTPAHGPKPQRSTLLSMAAPYLPVLLLCQRPSPLASQSPAPGPVGEFTSYHPPPHLARGCRLGRRIFASSVRLGASENPAAPTSPQIQCISKDSRLPATSECSRIWKWNLCSGISYGEGDLQEGRAEGGTGAMQPPAKGHQSCWQTGLPPRGAFGGSTALPARTRLHERMHSRCLKSPRLVICYPRHRFRGCLRQESSLAQT